MWKFGVKINAVALVEDDFLAFDVDKHTSFEYEVPHGMKALDGKTVRFLAVIM